MAWCAQVAFQYRDLSSVRLIDMEELPESGHCSCAWLSSERRADMTPCYLMSEEGASVPHFSHHRCVRFRHVHRACLCCCWCADRTSPRARGKRGADTSATPFIRPAIHSSLYPCLMQPDASGRRSSGQLAWPPTMTAAETMRGGGGGYVPQPARGGGRDGSPSKKNRLSNERSRVRLS